MGTSKIDPNNFYLTFIGHAVKEFPGRVKRHLKAGFQEVFGDCYGKCLEKLDKVPLVGRIYNRRIYNRRILPDPVKHGQVKLAGKKIKLNLKPGHRDNSSLSNIMSAAYEAVLKTNNGTVPKSMVLTSGIIEEVWVNGTEHENKFAHWLSEEILGAKNEIRIQNYKLDVTSDAGKEVINALAKKQKENPDFKIFIIYSNNGESMDKNLFSDALADTLANRGISAKVARYIEKPTRFVNHTKTVIIDGAIALYGGANIENHNEKDLTFKVRGNAVNTILADFKDAWESGKQWFYTGGLEAHRLPEKEEKDLPDSVVDRASVYNGPEIPMIFLSKNSKINLLDLYGNNADQGIIAALKEAKELIKIQTPRLIDPVIINELENAILRGVRVKMLLQKGYTDILSMLDADQTNDDLAVELRNRLPKDAKDRLEIRWFMGAQKNPDRNHSKYLSIDEKWDYGGSQNFDIQAMQYSREAGFGFDDPSAVKEIDEIVFDDDWNRGKVFQT